MFTVLTLERAQENDLMMQFKNLDKQEQTKSKCTRWQERKKIRAKLTRHRQKKKDTKRINDTKSLFFETINKIHKPLALLTKRKNKEPN